MVSMRLGEFEALVLTAVVRVGDGANGPAVYHAIEARTEGRDVSLPAVHVTLRRLVEKGLLTSEVGDAPPHGGRPQRFYAPTPDGARALREFRALWQRVWRGLELPDPETL
jgi:PadR family transcriptional regulator, regulatory protein PadR